MGQDPKDLQSALLRLTSATTTLNAIVDRAAETVRAVEQILADRHAGVQATVNISQNTDPNSGIGFRTDLGYVRVGGRYRIVVLEENDYEDEPNLKPWSDCSRENKLAAFERIPDLIIAIADVLEKMTAAAESTTTKVENALRSFCPPPPNPTSLPAIKAPPLPPKIIPPPPLRPAPLQGAAGLIITSPTKTPPLGKNRGG